MRDDALPVGKLLGAAGAVAGAITFALLVVLLILHHRRVPAGGLSVAPPLALAADQPMLEPAP